MKVDDKTSEILGRNFELSIDDAERLYNVGNFEKFSYSKIMSRAGQDLLLETAKTPVRLLGAVGQIPYAVETGAKFIRDRLPSSIKTDGNVIFGGKTAVDIMGKAKSVGDTLMEVSSRTLDEINKRAEKLLPRLSPEEQESTFNTYAQVGTQLSALLGLSMMSPKAGLDYITALTLGGETEEGFETYKAKNKGSMEGYGEQAGKDLFANLANTAIQRKIEGLIGIPGKMKFFRSAKELGRAGLYAGATGWLEEGTQGLTDAIIDDFNGRLEGQVDKDGKPLTWWTKWLSQVQEINAAAVVQGAMGVGFALNNRASVKNEIKSIVEKHVEPEKVNEVVNTVYDSMDLSIKNVVAKELEMSSSLQTKRGEVYESLYKAALEQVKVAKEQGGFPELQTEEDIANYVKGVADRFADETLAEAHRRNTVIEDVLDPSLIRYENGQLVMPMTKGTEWFDADKIMAERTTEFSYDEILHKLRFEEMSAEEEQRLTDMLDVEKQRLAPLFDTARGVVEELENEYGLVNELTDLSDAITERKMSFKEARDALGESFPEGQLADLGDEIKLKDGVKGNSAEIGFEYLTNRVFDRYDELRAKAQNYRLLQKGDEDKNLIVYHSISANNLSKAIDFGGFPVPSLAIVKKDQEFHFDNLPITLVGNREMIDPYYDSNEVYNRDVWTKTFPQVSYKTPSDAKIKKFKEKLKPYYKETSGEGELGSFTYVASRGNPSAALSEFASSSGAILYYLRNVKKQDVDLVKKDVASDILSRAGIDEELASKIRGLDVEADREEIGKAYLEMKKREIKERFSNMEDEGKREKFTKTLLESVQENKFDKDGKLYFSVADNIVYAANNYYLAKGKTAVDNYDARHQLRELIKDDDNYMEWATDFFEKELVGDKMVEVGKKLKPFTLENVVDAMTIGKTIASQDTPLPTMGKVIASGAKKLESIRDIKEESKKLVSFEKSRENMEEVTTSLYEFLDMFAKGDNFQENMDRKEAVAIALARVVKNKNITKESLVSSLRKELPSEKVFSDAIISNGLDVARKIKELSRYYFEAKPQRAIKIQEFSGAIIPTDVSFDEIAQKVEDSGLKVVRSDNQLEAVKEFDDVLFQKGVGREKGSIQFKGDRALITLTEEANSSTLAHELAHYWLQNTFLYSKSGLATPEYKQFFNSIAKYLDITDDQETIKEWQQEKWARAAEMYAMGKAPEGMEKPLTQYQQWIRKAYGEMSEPMYIDENGEAKVPEFDFETMKMFANLAGETLAEPEFKQKQEAVRGLAKSTNQMAQAKGMKTELPTYEKRSATDMGKKADEFIQRDKQLAIDIVKGLKPEQEGLFRQDLFAALRELALNEGDSDLLNELSKSMTVEEATELGQRIQALARGRIDPVKQMVELRDERMKKNKVDKKKLKEETERAKKEIKKEMAEASTPKEWADFIKSLEC